MIDIVKYEGHSTGWKRKINHSTYSIINDDGHKVASIGAWADVWKDKSNKDSQLIADAPLLLEEVKRLREEIKVLSKYRDIVEKYDDALLADGDTDPRWSELYA